jgi:hypothetical protein
VERYPDFETGVWRLSRCAGLAARVVYDLEVEGERVSRRVVEEEVRNLVVAMKRGWWVREKRAKLEREGGCGEDS